jgi:hypothetical protein
MSRVRAVYRNGKLELEQDLVVPDGTMFDVDLHLVKEEEDWQSLGLSRLEEEWQNPNDSVYDDWKRLYGV